MEIEKHKMKVKKTCLFGLLLTLPLVVALALGNPQTASPQESGKEKMSAEEIADHEATGFPLKGRHGELACSDCHGDGSREVKPDCRHCHQPPHDAGFKRACSDCHSSERPFPQVTFRHPAKDLWSFHQNVACVRCHPERKFLTASRQCISCHVDYHQGALGGDCYRCHRRPSWNSVGFNHNETGFPLLGAHLALECGDCHRDLQNFRIVPRPSGCVGCHEADQRAASFPHLAYGAGADCQECHLQDKWSYAHSPFWFNIQTGQHAGLACDNCHKSPPLYRQYSCHDCHSGHAGDHDGRCLDCHGGGFPGRQGGRP